MSVIERTQIAVDFAAKYYAKTGGVFCQDLYDNAKVIDITTDSENLKTVHFLVHTVPKLKNNMGMVHGGASSTMLILFSALALASDDKYWSGSTPTNKELEEFVTSLGATRSADIQIMQAVPLNADITVRCHILSNTKSNAFIIGTILNSKGKVLVTAVHDMMKHPPTGTEPNTLKSHFPHKL